MGETLNYISTNKRCYNKFAEVYLNPQYRYNAESVAWNLVRIINGAMEDQLTKKQNYRILELGCGTGDILKKFEELQNRLNNKYQYDLYGIDFAEKMIEQAKGRCLYADIANENVLTINNTHSLPFAEEDEFDVIIMKSLIHLFPYKDAVKLLNNVKCLLDPNGLMYIDTTLEKEFVDGVITDKQIGDVSMPRLRTHWTEKSFEDFLDDCGFEIIRSHSANHRAITHKIWLQRIVKIKN